MKIYLKDIKTNEIKQTFSNVKGWDKDYIIFDNGGCTGKIYCDIKTEYFTDILEENLPEVEVE